MTSPHCKGVHEQVCLVCPPVTLLVTLTLRMGILQWYTIDCSFYYFPYFPWKHVVGTHWKCLGEVLLIRTHNICFWGEIRKYNVDPYIRHTFFKNTNFFGYFAFMIINIFIPFLHLSHNLDWIMSYHHLLTSDAFRSLPEKIGPVTIGSYSFLKDF